MASALLTAFCLPRTLPQVKSVKERTIALDLEERAANPEARRPADVTGLGLCVALSGGCCRSYGWHGMAGGQSSTVLVLPLCSLPCLQGCVMPPRLPTQPIYQTTPPPAVGELPREHYARLRAAGADRYLLRIESSNPELYASIHPPAQKWENRVRCLRDLKDLGFMVRGVLGGAGWGRAGQFQWAVCGRQVLHVLSQLHSSAACIGHKNLFWSAWPSLHGIPHPRPAPPRPPDRHGRDGGAAGPDTARPGWRRPVLPGPGGRHDWHGGCSLCACSRAFSGLHAPGCPSCNNPFKPRACGEGSLLGASSSMLCSCRATVAFCWPACSIC